MEIIGVDSRTIDEEHICCAISNKKEDIGISSKKCWMKQQFEHGLTFKKINVRGKAFIEYIPAEAAWCPITADGYMFINCFWVSGQWKGHGYANDLLAECIRDAKEKGKKGLVVVSSAKKIPYLSDPKYLTYKGFQVCDTASPYFKLLHLPFKENTPSPQFKECCKAGSIDQKGMVLYYTNQCPHTEKYVPSIKQLAEERGHSLAVVKFETAAQAQEAPTPFTTYSFFYEGMFVTHENFSQGRFIKFLEQKGISWNG